MEPSIPRPIASTRPPAVRFPEGSVDCHAHVFDDPAKGGLLPNPHFVPHECTVQDYQRMLQTLGCTRAVLVQPSVYGTDNTLLLHALRAADIDMRGVVIVDPSISDHDLQLLHDQGVRGVRINTASATPGLKLQDASRLAERIGPMRWHLQFFVDLMATPEAADVIAALPVTAVIDHFGRVPASEGTESASFHSLMHLMSLPHCWIKLMGPYFISRSAPHYEDIDPLAKALLRLAPDRCVWGSDWPHPSARDLMPNDGDLADLLLRWAPDQATLERVLVSNPERLYGFDPT